MEQNLDFKSARFYRKYNNSPLLVSRKSLFSLPYYTLKHVLSGHVYDGRSTYVLTLSKIEKNKVLISISVFRPRGKETP